VVLDQFGLEESSRIDRQTLKGIVDSHGEDFVILDVHGVGYIVHRSGRTLRP